jgi:metalloendopeptidase OMA1, mitochondrial
MTAAFWVALAVFASGCMHSSIVNRKQLLLVTTAQEMDLGRKAFAATLKKENLCANGAAVANLEAIGKRIASVSQKPGWAWEFKLINKAKALNAFALPGGKVAVYTGLYGPLKNEASLAAVMGHEVAHAIARHGAERISRNMVVQAGVKAVDINMQKSAHRASVLGALGVGATVGVMLPFSREMELEADGLGLMYMANAGYDPREAVYFWQRFSKLGGATPELLSTHPAGATRIANLQRLMATAITLYDKSAKLGKGRPVAVPTCGSSAPDRP